MSESNDTSNLAARAAGVLIAAATFSPRLAQASGGRLLVFLHVAVKQRALQVALQSGLGSVDVTAVGRIGDFERTLKSGTDAVLASTPVLSAFRLRVRLRGERGGRSEEPYSLVGVGAEPEAGRVGAIGALDLLGRDGTNSFVRSLLGSSPRVERVSKVEDLLPLLQMQRVDAVLLPTRLFAEIKSASKLALVAKELGHGVGLPALASVTAAGEQVAAAVASMSPALSRTLGVDSWR